MATYTIREVAQRFHVQTSTLRYYEDQGLLCDVERDDAGRRVYTDSHIGRLEAIACFKHAGMSIDELKRFFAYEKDERAHIADMLELLESRHQAILKQRPRWKRRTCMCCANCTCIAIFSTASKRGRHTRIGRIMMARIFAPTISEVRWTDEDQ